MTQLDPCEHYDVALRDVGLMVGAHALARLAAPKPHTGA